MKKAFLLLLLFSSFVVNAQSLKEALYSGKLKNEPGTVIRKGDDLSTKMDTTTRKAPARDTLAVIAVAQPAEPAQNKPVSQTAPASAQTTTQTTTEAETTPANNTAVATASAPAAKPKDNNAIWKEYMNTFTATLKSEVLSSKKVKKGDYYVLVSYAIGTDGQVTITDVFVEPQNEFLQQQIKDRLSLEAPKLNPVLNSAGTPRKVNKKYNFTLTKE